MQNCIVEIQPEFYSLFFKLVSQRSQNFKIYLAILKWISSLFIVCEADLYILMLCVRALVTPSLKTF